MIGCATLYQSDRLVHFLCQYTFSVVTIEVQSLPDNMTPDNMTIALYDTFANPRGCHIIREALYIKVIS